METLKIVMAVLVVFAQVGALFTIEKVREPLTPGMFLVNCLTSALLVIALLS